MPDLEVDSERSELLRTRQPINDQLPYHPYLESEFPEGKGHCDSCGGGPDAPIHQKPVDQLARIADALEDIVNVFSQLPTADSFVSFLGDVAKTLMERTAPDPTQRFVADVFGPRLLMYFEDSPNEEGGEAFADWLYAGFPEYWEVVQRFLREPSSIESCSIKDRPGFTAFIEGLLRFDPKFDPEEQDD